MMGSVCSSGAGDNDVVLVKTPQPPPQEVQSTTPPSEKHASTTVQDSARNSVHISGIASPISGVQARRIVLRATELSIAPPECPNLVCDHHRVELRLVICTETVVGVPGTTIKWIHRCTSQSRPHEFVHNTFQCAQPKEEDTSQEAKNLVRGPESKVATPSASATPLRGPSQLASRNASPAAAAAFAEAMAAAVHGLYEARPPKALHTRSDSSSWAGPRPA